MYVCVEYCKLKVEKKRSIVRAYCLFTAELAEAASTRARLLLLYSVQHLPCSALLCFFTILKFPFDFVRLLNLRGNCSAYGP
jgi:hypothetical protein